MHTRTEVIEARALRRTFGQFVAVDNVSFAVETGQIFGFLGPTGAGKTTTIKMLTGLVQPTGGVTRRPLKSLRKFQASGMPLLPLSR